jgi:hypothetical protein
MGYGTFCQVIANYHQSSPSVISYDLGVIFLMNARGGCGGAKMLKRLWTLVFLVLFIASADVQECLPF